MPPTGLCLNIYLNIPSLRFSIASPSCHQCPFGVFGFHVSELRDEVIGVWFGSHREIRRGEHALHEAVGLSIDTEASFGGKGIQLGRTPGAVEKKVDHLSLGAGPRTTTTVSFTEGLLSYERATLFSCLRIVDFQFINLFCDRLLRIRYAECLGVGRMLSPFGRVGICRCWKHCLFVVFRKAIVEG